MKEKGSTPSSMISRNWVLKRKRKKLPYGPETLVKKDEEDLAAESAGVSCSTKDSHNTERRSKRLISKKKGNDGVIYSFYCF